MARRGCRCGLWASGPPLDTCRPGGGCDRLEGSGADLSRLWEPQALLRNLGFCLVISYGETGSLVHSYDCLGARWVLRWKVGPQMQEPLVLSLPSLPLLFYPVPVGLCCPFLFGSSISTSFGEISYHLMRVGLALAPRFQG